MNYTQNESFGSCTIYQGNCLEVLRGIPDESVDMVLTDPPYGTTACKWDSVIPFDHMWGALSRVCKKDSNKVFTASQPFTSFLVTSNPSEFKCEWVWKKNAGSNFGQVKYQPMKEHEAVLVFCAGRGVYNPQMQERAESGKQRVKTVVNYNTKTEVYGGKGDLANKVSSNRPDLRYPSSVQNFNRERGLHPTQKPVALMEYLIKTYTNEGDTVLDFTMGSGTTGVACVNTRRKFIGIELDEKYYDIARGRLRQADITDWFE